MRWKPSGMLVIMRGFCPSNLVAGILGFLQQRDGYLFDDRALLPQDANCFVKCVVNCLGNYFKKKSLRQTETKWATRKGFGKSRGALQGWLSFPTDENGIEQ